MMSEPDSGRSCPAGWLWLVFLYLRPRTFFTHFVIDSTPGLTALCAWFYGMAGIIDRVESESLVNPDVLLGTTWVELWIVTLVGGIVTGWLYFKIGGWWFRMRIDFAGASKPDKGLARRVYIFASMVLALPILSTQIGETGTQATPWDASQSERGFWYFSLLVFPIWSAWSSYAGVRTAFDVRKRAAILWFLVLPVAVYGFVILSVVVFLYTSLWGPADVSNTRWFHQGNSFTFYYPGNWKVETDYGDYDPDGYVCVTATQDVMVEILFHEVQGDGDEVAAVDTAIAFYHDFIAGLQEIGTFQEWGRHEGTGRLLQGVSEGQECFLRVFVSILESGNQLEIHEIWLKDDEAAVLPGIQLIRSSFELN